MKFIRKFYLLDSFEFIRQLKLFTDVTQKVKKLSSSQAAEVELMIKSIDCQADKKKKQDQLLTYLQNNKDRINYKDYLAQGLFIGSGAMESANREVVQKRMKLSGQRWTLEGAQQVANLRVSFKNRHWDKLIEQIKIAA